MAPIDTRCKEWTLVAPHCHKIYDSAQWKLPSVTTGKIVDLVVPQCRWRLDSGPLWLPADTRSTITDPDGSLSLEVR